jgi:hypothetical protein
MDDNKIRQRLSNGILIDETINYLKNTNYDVNKYTTIFKNTLFLWTIFNCSSIGSLALLNNKNELKLDINKPSQYKYKLSPLMAVILKGRYRTCDNKEQDTMSKVIDQLLDQKDVDLKYTTYGCDALKISIAMFDYKTIKIIMDKDSSSFTYSHFYFYKFIYNSIDNEKQNEQFLKKYNLMLKEIANPIYELTIDHTKIFSKFITKYINSKIELNLKKYEELYTIYMEKWNNIDLNLLNFGKQIYEKEENINKLIYIGNTNESLTVMNQNLLYLSILKNPKFAIFILSNHKKFDHQFDLYNEIYNPIQLCILNSKEINDIYDQIFKLILNLDYIDIEKIKNINSDILTLKHLKI